MGCERQAESPESAQIEAQENIQFGLKLRCLVSLCEASKWAYQAYAANPTPDAAEIKLRVYQVGMFMADQAMRTAYGDILATVEWILSVEYDESLRS